MGEIEKKEKATYEYLGPDGYTRYALTAEIIKSIFGKNKVNVLDIGGKDTLLWKVLDEFGINYEYTIVDILEGESTKDYKYVKSSGTDLPFKDNFFDVVLSTDVLEHIDDKDKIKFVAESARVTKGISIIAAPFASPELEYAEKTANDFYRDLFGEDHKWLAEHFTCKKPQRIEIEKWLKQNDFKFNLLNSTRLDDWLLTVTLNFIAERYATLLKDVQKLNKYFNNNFPLYGNDQNPAYREFYIIYKNKILENKININNENKRDIKKLLVWDNLIVNFIGKNYEREKKLQTENLMLLERKTAKEEKIKSLSDSLNNITRSKLWKATRLVVSVIDIPKHFSLLLSQIIAIYRTKGFLRGSRTVCGYVISVILKKNNHVALSMQYSKWFKKNYPHKKTLAKQSLEINDFDAQPKISIIVPTYNTNPGHLRECIESVLNQSYKNFELCLADDNSKNQEVRDIIEEYASKDKRIKYIFREKNGHICEASNSALGLATGDFIGLLDHDDILWPNALFEVVKAINSNPEAEIIYSDEDKLEEDGKTHVDPFFKPDWSPHYLLSINYITHFTVLKHSLVKKINGFRLGTEGAQDWDLFLRATREIIAQNPTLSSKPFLQNKKIIHIPTILYSWRKSPDSTASEKTIGIVKNYAYVNQQKVLRDYHGKNATVTGTEFIGLWQTKYRLKRLPLVSIIIPSKDKYKYIKTCLESILSTTTYKNYEIILVDTGSTDKNVWELYDTYKMLFKNQLKIVKWDKSFNFSSVCNFGASQASGEYLILLNNDTKIITENWIEGMLEYAQQDGVGAVGIKLIYPDEKVQHAGIVTGLGIASHYMQGQEDNIHQSFPMVLAKDVVRDVSGVTAACFMTPKKLFEEIGGLNEDLKIAYNDVDYCLEIVNKLKLLIVFNPHVKLVHYESISVGTPNKGTRDYAEFIEENNYMYKKWGDIIINDPYYNKNLTKKKEDFSLDI